MNEMEVAEMIEQHIDYYVEDEDGNRRSVHLPTPFVRHYMKRDDGALPTVVAIATAPIVLADGELLAPDGLDRLRGIHFIIPDELRAIIPSARTARRGAVKAAMKFLSDEWLVDVATDYAGKCTIIAAALTMIERSLLTRPAVLLRHRRPPRRRQDHDAHHADHGRHRAVAGGGGVVDQRGGAAQGAAELLHATACATSSGTTSRAARRSPARTSRRAAPSAYYSDRKLGVSEMVAPPPRPSISSPATTSGRRATWPRAACTSASTSTAPTPRTGTFKHPDPIGWTESHRAEILAALYTILLGNPQLKRAARRAVQDPVQDVVAPGRIGGRARRQARRATSSISRICSSSRRRTTRNRPRSPTCSKSW